MSPANVQAIYWFVFNYQFILRYIGRLKNPLNYSGGFLTAEQRENSIHTFFLMQTSSPDISLLDFFSAALPRKICVYYMSSSGMSAL